MHWRQRLRAKNFGAAIDVFPKEPKSADEEFESPLRAFDNVILTPHVGGSTQEAQANIGLKWLKNLYAILIKAIQPVLSTFQMSLFRLLMARIAYCTFTAMSQAYCHKSMHHLPMQASILLHSL